MRCPYCDHSDTRVLDSRLADAGRSIRRRRECSACSRRFTTYERFEETPVMVVKKDGRREKFQRRKILDGIMRACEKRPVPYEAMEGVAAQIEQELRQRGEAEVTAEEIGEKVMEEVRRLDDVAYVRFASVYKEFKDVSSFMRELEELLRSRPAREEK